MPLSLANELMGYWAFGEPLCQLWLCTDVLLCTASIFSLAKTQISRLRPKPRLRPRRHFMYRVHLQPGPFLSKSQETCCEEHLQNVPSGM